MPRWTVVVAPNAFKGSLDALAAAGAMGRGARAALPDVRLLEVPVADGGDGTAAVLLETLGGRWVSAAASDPWGHPCTARFAMLGDGRTAVVDVAAASGLGGRRPSPPQALAASSHGTGALVRCAIESGARHIWISLGGSGCTDGGSGLLRALGARVLDGAGRELPPGGGPLIAVRHVELEGLQWAAGIDWTALVDVRNPLLGPTGAAAVFAPQKGAGPAEVAALESSLKRWADALETAARRDGARDLPGAGAAGGCGFGLAAALGAALRPGAAAVAQAVSLSARLVDADLVLTGEGAIDAQTAYGKAPAHVAALAVAAGIPAVALVGSLGPGWEGLLTPRGDLTAVLPLPPGPRGRRAAMRATAADLERTAEAAVRLILAGAGRAGPSGGAPAPVRPRRPSC